MSHRTIIPGLLAVMWLAGAGVVPAAAQEPADSAKQAEARAGEPEKAEKKKIRRHPDRISAEELAELGSGNALEAVRRLRSSWLRTRGVANPAGGDPIVVYLDGVRVGELAALEEVRIASVEEIRRLKGTDAVTRYGRGHDSGAIVVTTKH